VEKKVPSPPRSPPQTTKGLPGLEQPQLNRTQVCLDTRMQPFESPHPRSRSFPPLQGWQESGRSRGHSFHLRGVVRRWSKKKKEDQVKRGEG